MIQKLIDSIRSIFSPPVDAASLRPPAERTGPRPAKNIRPIAPPPPIDAASPSAQSNPQVGEDDPFWQSVYDARAAFYNEHIGQLPDDILKIGHMFGVWPGGGLYVIPARQGLPARWVYSSFGFTNADMPARATARDVEVERDELGRVTSTSATISSKAPQQVAAGLAGYGYEFLVLADEQAEWPLWLLQWAANAELLNDVGLLKRVEDFGGLTVQELRVGESEEVHVLIAKARAPFPAGMQLPNGRVDFLVATTISAEEMQWSMQHGREALLDRLMRESTGQRSDRARASIV